MKKISIESCIYLFVIVIFLIMAVQGMIKADHYQVAAFNWQASDIDNHSVQMYQAGKKEERRFQKIVSYLESVNAVKQKDLTKLQESSFQQVKYSKYSEGIFQAFVIGSLFIIAVSHFMIFIYRRKERSALFISIACLTLMLRFSSVGVSSIMFKDVFHLTPETIVWMDLIFGLLAILFYFLFIDREFNPTPNKYVTSAVVWTLSLYILSIILLPLSWSVQTFLIYQVLCFIVLAIILFISFQAARYKKYGAYLNVVGLLIFFLLLWNDMVGYSTSIPTEIYIFFGMLVYVYLLSIHLSRKTSQSFDRTESLSRSLQKLNDSLETSVQIRTAELETANGALQKMGEERQRLLGNVAHELSTPLTFIKGYIRAMMNEIIPKDDATYLREVYNEVTMMTQMVTDLQEISRLESKQMSFKYEAIPIREFFIETYQSQQVLFKDSNIDFVLKEHLDEHWEEAICTIDPIRIRQIINNLIGNARKFTDEGGKIMMDVEIPSNGNRNEMKLKIIDTGIGIEEQDLPYLFERFYKVEHTSISSVRGSGLGLVLAKEIVEAHKGTIGVESKINKGSTFYITLPMQRAKVLQM